MEKVINVPWYLRPIGAIAGFIAFVSVGISLAVVCVLLAIQAAGIILLTGEYRYKEKKLV